MECHAILVEIICRKNIFICIGFLIALFTTITDHPMDILDQDIRNYEGVY